jgi:hypothetical protein
LKGGKRADRFRAEELKEANWNPLIYMQSLANSLYLLIARDFALIRQPTGKICA